jgi:hypothetical protein
VTWANDFETKTIFSFDRWKTIYLFQEKVIGGIYGIEFPSDVSIYMIKPINYNSSVSFSTSFPLADKASKYRIVVG